ncbi:Carboxyl-terminal-processing protease [Hordeum vulgare]|nr:Carboxyl-terminal-processing protease [Hordeum vulgare]
MPAPTAAPAITTIAAIATAMTRRRLLRVRSAIRSGVIAALVLRATGGTTRGAATVGGATARESKHRGALIGGPLLHGFLGQDDPREDGVER